MNLQQIAKIHNCNYGFLSRVVANEDATGVLRKGWTGLEVGYSLMGLGLSCLDFLRTALIRVIMGEIIFNAMSGVNAKMQEILIHARTKC